MEQPEPDLMPRRISYLRLSIIGKCDMECGYCIPCRRLSSARDIPSLSLNEISTLVRAFAENGVTKVRLTGGEPLLRDDLVEIVRSVAATPGVSTVGLTTNGVRLGGLAGELADAGLQCVNVSLDSLDRETFRRITGRDALDDVLPGIDAALRYPFQKVKLNTVVMRGLNEHEVPAIADFAGELGVEARFIELMPLGHGSEEWRAMHVPASEVRDILGYLDPLPYDGSSSARLYRRAGHRAVIGIISPMSEDFCGGCSRVRVMCDGKLKPCLRLPVEEDIRPLIGRPELGERLGEMLVRLSRCKLSGTAAAESAVQSEDMCAVGG